MIKKFNEWWKVWGQVWGFVLHVIFLNGFWMMFTEEMQNDWRYSAGWLVSFFVGALWYVWQMKKHGWRLPKDIKNTH